MHRLVPYYAALADFRTPGLELRFNQRQQLRIRFGKGQWTFEHFGKPDKACVTNDQIDAFGDVDIR